VGDDDLHTAAQALLDDVIEAMEVVAPRSGVDPQDLPGEDVCELVIKMHDYLRAALAAATEPPEPCDECETTGQNCRAHRSRPVWQQAAGPVPDPQGTDEPGEHRQADPELIAELEILAMVMDEPDQPTDDDLTELQRHAQVLAEEQWRQTGYGPAARHRDAVAAAVDALPGLLAEVERLRAAAEALATEAHETEQVLAAALPDEFPTLPDSDVRCTGEHVLPTLAAHVVRELRAAAGSPPPTPAPTREQVRHQVNAALRDANEPFSYTQVNRIANAVMLLLAGEPKYPEATDG
jgi:hypothetical protein